jgi:hypothetical protein
MATENEDEAKYKEFCTQWAKAIEDGRNNNPLTMLLLNLNVQVRCRSCHNLINGEDAVLGAELYCPKCGAGWVVWAK